MIYLDNAATSYPKPKCVLESLYTAAKRYSGNPGRSSHSLSLKAAEIIFGAREKIASLFNHSTPESVVFTYNATYALNIAIKSIVTEGHVIISDIEHNAVVRPLRALERCGVRYSVFSSDGDITANIESEICEDTVAIISTLASNVTGSRIDIDILSKCAEKHNLTLIVDASQAAGHIDIDLAKNSCDVLCAPAHKGLFGIQGAGFAVFKDTRRKNTILEGGSGMQSISAEMPELLPEGYEAGTLSTPTIAALGAGVDFVKKIGVSNIGERINCLTDVFLDRLRDIRGIKIYPSCNGIIAFNLLAVPSSYVGRELDKRDVAVRTGLHCAPSAHKKLGTLESGCIRASLSYFNTIQDADSLYKALLEISCSL